MDMPLRVSVSGWNKGRLFAWFRDVQNRLDVMHAAVLLGIRADQLGSWVAARTSARAHVEYWNTIEDKSDLVMPTGPSEHSISTAFEINYVRSFRSIYLVKMFGPNIARSIRAAYPDFPVESAVSNY